MKATIDLDEALYRRLKIEAARRGRTVRELVAEGVRYILDAPDGSAGRGEAASTTAPWNPAWLGSLQRYGSAIEDHSMDAVRESVARARRQQQGRARGKERKS
ncbi:MAG: hypothetical protein IT359_09860 [Gemmatimonadaceae bacterium]|nr:hypothetical protein [Gemmatimonadaceae bacterium]